MKNQQRPQLQRVNLRNCKSNAACVCKNVLKVMQFGHAALDVLEIHTPNYHALAEMLPNSENIMELLPER